VAVNVWSLDLQPSVQSVSITTNIISSNPVHGEVYSIQHYVIKFVSDLRQVSSTNKTGRHDTTEILLKMALNTIQPNQPSNNCLQVLKITFNWYIEVHEMCISILNSFSG